MINGKATLIRQDYCDMLGDCLPVCPPGAISFDHREALAYNEAAVFASKAKKSVPAPTVQILLDFFVSSRFLCGYSVIQATEKKSPPALRGKQDLPNDHRA